MPPLQENLATLHSWLQGLESPYFWNPTKLIGEEERLHILTTLKDKELHAEDTKKVFTFNNFVIKLLLSYELFVTAGNSSAALRKMEQTEIALHRLDIVSNCSFYHQVRRAQWHTLLASRAILLATEGRLEESKEVAGENFDHVTEFSKEELAGIYGIKSRAYLEYGPKAWPEALRWAKEAIQANPQEAEWYFLAARALENTRMDDGKFNGIPEEEIGYFNKAVALEGRENHAFHLAAVLERLVRHGFMVHGEDHQFKDSPLHSELKNMSKRVVQIYKNIQRKAGNDTETRLRCLEGLLRQPKQNLNFDELRKELQELSKEPKRIKMFYNVAGNFYLKVDKDQRRAMQFLEQGSTLGYYPCSVNALRLRYQRRQLLDVEQALRELAVRYHHHTPSYENALSHLGAYFMFMRRNLVAALEVFNTILEHRPRSRSLLVHKPIFVKSPRPLNLLAIVANEIRAAAVTSDLPPLAKNKFLDILKTHHPNLLSRSIDYNLLHNILKQSDKMSSKLRKRPRHRPPQWRGIH